MKLKRVTRRIGFHGLRLLALLSATGGADRLKALGIRLGHLHYTLRYRLRKQLARQLETLAMQNPSPALRADHDAILKTAFEVSDRALLEVIALYASRKPAQAISPKVLVHNISQLELYQTKKEGIILLGMHMGNGVAMAAQLNRSHGPIHVVYRESNKVPHGFLRKGLERLGLNAVNASGPGAGFREMLKALKAGQIVFILMDQGTKESGVTVDFLGKPVLMPKGPAELARRSGAPIVPVFLTETEPAWTFELGEPLYLNQNGAIQDQVAEISQCMSAHILAHPQWWSWHQRRWRKLPFTSLMTGVT